MRERGCEAELDVVEHLCKSGCCRTSVTLASWNNASGVAHPLSLGLCRCAVYRYGEALSTREFVAKLGQWELRVHF